MTDVPTTPRRPMPEMRRLRIWERHGGVCVLCGLKIDGTKGKWTIEHLRALGLGGEDTDENCGPAHEDCRRAKDKQDVPMIAKAKRRKIKFIGGHRSRNPLPGGRQSKWKKKINGEVVLR